ncbi:MAG: hypothetical protein GPJ10_13075 [Microcystis aeruginosa L211-07]|nr:hypothetical protein [Microcystis aeruginosa L211-07]
MTILLANLGTSDLTIKVQNFWLPFGFRDEPNVDETGLTEQPEKETAWKKREQLIVELLETQSSLLDLKEIIRQKKIKTYHLKNLTSQLHQLQHSKNDVAQPHNQIQLKVGRLLGIVKTAYEKFQARKVYLFVTDQPSSKEEVEHQDTVYLFELLKKLLEEEIRNWQQADGIDSHLIIEKVTISQEISAVDQDKLLMEYYNFFNTLDSQEEILISIKGGTPQMQTALRIQAIASNIQKQIFLEPKLVVKDLLEGQASKCEPDCYWQYMRNQKYATVKLLLNQRWDFDGARVILKDWQETLIYLAKQVPKIASDTQKEQEKLTEVIKKLNLAVSCFNLDKNALRDNEQMEHNFWLNLYTQCRIYWGLDEIANFLIRLSSFYEVTLNELIMGLRGQKYLRNNNQNQYLAFVINKASQEFCNKFEELELNVEKKDSYTLVNRYSKRNFVQTLIEIDHPDRLELWQQILASLVKLDYWFDNRNALIHSGRGVSVQTMINQLEEGKRIGTDDKDKYKADPDKACHPNNILGEVLNIAIHTYQLLGQKSSPYVGWDKNTPYYLYSQLRDEICQQLI